MTSTAHRPTVHSCCVATIAMALTLGAHALSAQESSSPRGGWAIGASVGMPGVGTSPVAELSTIGVHFTQLTPGRAGADISIGTMPRILAEGVAAGAIRAGITVPFALAPGVLLLPSAGASVVGAASPGGMGGTYGLYAGASTVIGAGNTGVRVGATVHQLGASNIAVWLMELGLTSIPR